MSAAAFPASVRAAAPRCLGQIDHQAEPRGAQRLSTGRSGQTSARIGAGEAAAAGEEIQEMAGAVSEKTQPPEYVPPSQTELAMNVAKDVAGEMIPAQYRPTPDYRRADHSRGNSLFYLHLILKLIRFTRAGHPVRRPGRAARYVHDLPQGRYAGNLYRSAATTAAVRDYLGCRGLVEVNSWR